MRGRIRLIALLSALAGSGLPAGQAQQPQPVESTPVPTFRAGVEYVEVDALVADQQGNFVRGLHKEDFEVVEDGQVQRISAFSFVDLPHDTTTGRSLAADLIEPDTQSNTRPFDGRVYVMVLDDLHVDTARSSQVKLAARQFIERNLGANDLMAITFTGRTAATQEFTSSRRLLLNAVDTFLGSRVLGSTLSRNESYRQRIDLPTGGAPWPLDDANDNERGKNAQSMLLTLRQVSAWLGDIHGRRKTLMLFSEGIDYDLSAQIRGPVEKPSPAGPILSQLRETLAVAARSNVSVYAIDPRALTTVSDAGVGGLAGHSEPFTGIGVAALSRELKVSQDNLRQLSDESGGFAAVNRNDFADVFDRIVRDNSAYYVLAYYPPSTSPAGTFRRINVNVKRPGLSVRARRGYAMPRAAPTANASASAGTSASNGAPPPELTEVMKSLLPVSGLTLHVFTAPFKGSRKNASVMIGIEVGGNGLGGDSESKLDLSFLAVDRNAKVFGARYDSLPLTRRAASTAVEQSDIRVLNRLELPPGRYRLRVAAFDTQQKRAGSVAHDLTVPDYSKDPVAISGITVTSLSGSKLMTAILDDEMKEALPAPFVARRAFTRNDQLDLFGEIYDSSGKAPHQVEVVTTVLTADGRKVTQNQDVHDSTEFKGSKRAFRYTAHLPLSALVPGDYVVSVEARSRLKHEVAAVRHVTFRVLPSAP